MREVVCQKDEQKPSTINININISNNNNKKASSSISAGGYSVASKIMGCQNIFRSLWRPRSALVLFLVILVSTVAQDEQTTCSAEGTCDTAGKNEQQQQQQSHQQQQFQQQQQQQQRVPSQIIETINIEFGEPQVVLNHDMDVTRLNIHHTQQYISMHPIWKSTCLNRHQLCSFWAAKGECPVNTWMREHCSPSCQTCPLPDEGPRGEQDQDTNASNNNNNPNANANATTSMDYISVTIPFGEPQVVPTVNADPVVQLIAKMLSYMQQQVYVEEKYEKVREECKCKDHRCAVWAAEGKRDFFYLIVS
jgi:hypothetical protein